jgi:uncharacterized membrane protein
MNEKILLALAANATSSLSRFAKAYVFTMLGLGALAGAGSFAMGVAAQEQSSMFLLACGAVLMAVLVMFSAALPVAVVVGILCLAFAK